MNIGQRLCSGDITILPERVTKWDAIATLVINAKNIPASLGLAVLAAVELRESCGSVVFWEEVAVLHCVHRGVEGSVLHIGVSKTGISWSDCDAQPVKIVFLVVAGNHRDCCVWTKSLVDYIVGTLSTKPIRAKLAGAQSPAQVLELLGATNAAN